MGRAGIPHLPSCKDTGHASASPQCTSGSAAAVRNRAGQVVSNPRLLFNAWAQKASPNIQSH